MADPSPRVRERPHVVVVGGGFGGLATVRGLRRVNVDVTLIDRHTYNTFQPLLYQVATATLNAGDITWFLRSIRSRRNNVRYLKGTVLSMDHAAKTLVLDGGQSIAYDYLIIAAGVTANYFGIPGAKEHAMPLYRRSQALAVRDAMFAKLEEAAINGQDRDLRIVVWASGVTVHEQVEEWGVPQGRGGRISVDDHLRVEGLEGVFAVGDIAVEAGDRALPQLAQPARQGGEYVATLLQTTLEGEDATPFRYHDKGALATIGRNSAVAQVKGLPRLKGFGGFWRWSQQTCSVSLIAVCLIGLGGGVSCVASALGAGGAGGLASTISVGLLAACRGAEDHPATRAGQGSG